MVSFSLFYVGRAAPLTCCADKRNKVWTVNGGKTIWRKGLEDLCGILLGNPKWILTHKYSLWRPVCFREGWGWLLRKGSATAVDTWTCHLSPPAHSQGRRILHMMGSRGRPDNCEVSVSCGHTEDPPLYVQDYKSPPHPTTAGLAPVSGLEGLAMLCDQLMRLQSGLAGKNLHLVKQRDKFLCFEVFKMSLLYFAVQNGISKFYYSFITKPPRN